MDTTSERTGDGPPAVWTHRLHMDSCWKNRRCCVAPFFQSESTLHREEGKGRRGVQERRHERARSSVIRLALIAGLYRTLTVAGGGSGFGRWRGALRRFGMG